jgi:hypothetical protein
MHTGVLDDRLPRRVRRGRVQITNSFYSLIYLILQSRTTILPRYVWNLLCLLFANQ